MSGDPGDDGEGEGPHIDSAAADFYGRFVAEEQVQLFRRLRPAADDPPAVQLNAATQALQILRQIALHPDVRWAAETLMTEQIGDREETDVTSARTVLRNLLMLSQAALPPDERGSDFELAVLPAGLWQEVVEACEQANAGDRPSFFEPAAPTNTTKPAWARERLQRHAVQLVYFLHHADDLPLGEARQRVASAYGVSPDAVRASWEKRRVASDDDVHFARAAGDLARRLRDDPQYGSRDGEAADAHALELLNYLLAWPAERAGALYPPGDNIRQG